MKIIHIQTNVQAIFGVLDEDGNVVTKQPINLEINKLTPELFQQALTEILKNKEKLENQLL